MLAGRYRLDQRVSVQGGSSVWKATDEALTRSVTARTFAPGFGRVGEVVAAARAACQLNDPRLVQIFDADDGPEHPYIVTEWPSGTRLDELLADGPIDPMRAARIIADAAGALAYAHAAGLAHQCLTPDSLWYTTLGELKISGLGIAAALAGVASADPALADTRGLARLLYAALTGCWPGEEPTTLPRAPRSDGRTYRPRQVKAGIPRDIDAVTCRALFGDAGGDGPPIREPAHLAAALAAITRAAERSPAPSPPYGESPSAGDRPPTLWPGPAAARAATQPLAPPRRPEPAWTRPVVPVQAAATASQPPTPSSATPVTPVTPVTSVTPAMPALPQLLVRPAAPASPRPGSPEAAQDSAWQPGEPPGLAQRRRTAPAKMLLGAAVTLFFAALTAGGWLIAREVITSHGAAEPRPTAGPVRTLTPAHTFAFDPYGDSEGDNRQLVPLAVDRDPHTAWHTDWYATAEFGNLKPGTGLVLDMGHPVTITVARITLSSSPGADLQLRAGATTASLRNLRMVARASNAAGHVVLRLTAPAHARYVLFWFTRLPSDSSGTFQENVYDVKLEGRG